ncbi:hypothetical protein [Natronomonas marina]|uniref:hypothetical protein n=1 Tax=Natronomonas marina TaxID=2961939 RepID=UPI0020CA2438|nr:hypothetical protein [Natronomonas marina]
MNDTEYDSYAEYVRGRLDAGDLARYSGRGLTVWMYARDGAYYQLRVTESRFTADEREVSEEKVERVVEHNYPVETAAADSVPNTVRAWADIGVEGVAREWFIDARMMLSRFEDVSNEDASEMMRDGLRLAGRIDDTERAEKLRERVQEIGARRDG